MYKQILTIFYLLCLTAACRGRRPDPRTNLLPRDTTIVPAVAVTGLRLDSSAVQHFVDSAIKDSAVVSGIVNFYNNRNYQFAWFNEDGITDAGDAFRNLLLAGTINGADRSPSAGRRDIKDDRFDDSSYAASNEHQTARAELELTLRFFQYIAPTISDTISPRDLNWYIPVRRLDPVEALDSFLTGRTGSWRLLGKRFYRLKDKLRLYSLVLKAGGWPALHLKGKLLKKGMTGPEIDTLKRRLQSSGDLSMADSGNKFDALLEEGVRRAQRSFGLPETGIVDKKLEAELNVPVVGRIRQMIINLQRMKWMPAEDTGYILANIPEYRLRVYQGDSIELAMPIVVGKEASHTVIFSDSLRYIVFSPYWNIPASIVKKEVVPAIKRDKGYLASHNMEIAGYRDGLPIVRQRPGKGNALGKVKFLFPNRFHIYFHDTPQRNLFDRSERAFSHGCIRLGKPFQLAKLLLTGASWTDRAIHQAMNGTTEKWVTLQHPIPVYIVYFTAWVDECGVLHFAKDIYDHDRVIAGHLFKE